MKDISVILITMPITIPKCPGNNYADLVIAAEGTVPRVVYSVSRGNTVLDIVKKPHNMNTTLYSRIVHIPQ
jgi:hypothetical protein